MTPNAGTDQLMETGAYLVQDWVVFVAGPVAS